MDALDRRVDDYFQARWRLCEAIANRIRPTTNLRALRDIPTKEWPREMVTQCWEWTATRQVVRYRGNRKVLPKPILYTPWNKKGVSAARLIFEMFVTPLAPNQRLRRACHNPYCVSPLHHRIKDQETVSVPKIEIPNSPDLEIAELVEMIDLYVAKNGVPETIAPILENFGEVYTMDEIMRAWELLFRRSDA